MVVVGGGVVVGVAVVVVVGVAVAAGVAVGKVVTMTPEQMRRIEEISLTFGALAAEASHITGISGSIVVEAWLRGIQAVDMEIKVDHPHGILH